MDPAICLTDANQHINDGYRNLASMLLNDYADWRHRGGFEPVIMHGDVAVKGDIYHHALVIAYEKKFMRKGR